MDRVKNDSYYLKKIDEDISFIILITKNISFEQYNKDTILNNAVNFRFIQIAENTKELSDEIILKDKTIPWAKISGLRNKIVHDYGNIYLDVIYETIKNDLPRLLVQIHNLES